MKRLLAGAFAALVFFCSGPAFALPTGTMVYQYNTYKHHTTNATFVDKAAPGLLHGICINTAGASANTVSIYDALTATNLVAAFDGTVRGCFFLDVVMLTGITVVSATGTPADFTIMLR